MEALDMLKRDLADLGNPRKAGIMSRFFKTGKGEYGEGDVFFGITVPEQRTIAKKYSGMGFGDLECLLAGKVHEYRLTALLILVEKYRKAENKKDIVDFYLDNLQHVNNWDLVDGSAPYILGNYLLEKDRSILYKLAKSQRLWERRIAIISTYAFIRNNDFDDTLKISEILMNDKHYLIHKAVGWMLREVGKKDQKAEERFLKKNYKKMPRTMLRYAIERFGENKRKFYMGR